jgi:hypothetical protein
MDTGLLEYRLCKYTTSAYLTQPLTRKITHRLTGLSLSPTHHRGNEAKQELETTAEPVIPQAPELRSLGAKSLGSNVFTSVADH